MNAGGSKDWPTTGAIATFLPISIAAPSASLPVVTFTNTDMLCALCGKPWPHFDPRTGLLSVQHTCGTPSDNTFGAERRPEGLRRLR